MKKFFADHSSSFEKKATVRHINIYHLHDVRNFCLCPLIDYFVLNGLGLFVKYDFCIEVKVVDLKGEFPIFYIGPRLRNDVSHRMGVEYVIRMSFRVLIEYKFFLSD